MITILELETGVLLIEQKDTVQGAVLPSWLNAHVLPAFYDRILVVDTAVAQCCAKLHVPDPRIAATAIVHEITVVSRNVSDFESSGVKILNPWKS